MCGKRVIVNSVQCTYCRRWLRKRHSSIKGSAFSRAGGFAREQCNEGRVSRGGPGSVVLERVCEVKMIRRFCYLVAGSMVVVEWSVLCFSN